MCAKPALACFPMPRAFQSLQLAASPAHCARASLHLPFCVDLLNFRRTPSHSYGASGSPPSIPPNSALVFTMEIISINGRKVPAAPRCDVTSLENCTEQEAAFVAKQKARMPDERAAEVKRLAGLVDAKMAPEKVAWMRSRLALLKAIVKAVDSKQEL